ncbi:acetylcholinesterase [Thozetella sp. PMI_491]|nr:acetylcholinesterase [Thozetella sp. PMI_491]
MSIPSESKNGVEYLTIESTAGSVKGFINKDYPGVAQFLGIRFAEAPIGPRRWLPPVPKAPADWIDATQFGPSCPQWKGGPRSVYNSVVTELQIRDDMDEDCLSVCIWTPAKAAKDSTSAKLPVIVWITGGAFLVGGSTIPYQNPTPWVEQSQRHIVVCINYRLTIFGFPNAAGLEQGQKNVGLLDQRLGLEWVHEHIASFGGDPDRLTHYGQSAGALGIDFHSFQYPDRPLVRGLIMSSGVAMLRLPYADPQHQYFTWMAKKLGFDGDDPADELEFMRQQPAKKLIQAIEDQFYTGEAPFLNFQPVVDGVTVFDDYEELSKQGKFSRLPAIIGTLAEEGNSLVGPYNPDGPDIAAAKRITKTVFLEPAVKAERARSGHATTFRYLFKDPAPEGTCSFPNISPRPFLRAYHSSDLPLVFGTHPWYRGPSTKLEEKISSAWQDLFVAFAEDGPEGLQKLGWNDASKGEGIVLGIGDKGWESVSLKEIDDSLAE